MVSTLRGTDSYKTLGEKNLFSGLEVVMEDSVRGLGLDCQKEGQYSQVGAGGVLGRRTVKDAPRRVCRGA